MTSRRLSITVRPLRGEADAGLSAPGTAAQRLALVETLTAEAWALMGREMPTYARPETPVHVRTLRSALAVREHPAGG